MAQLGSLLCILRALDGAILGQVLCQGGMQLQVFFSALGLLSQRQMWAGLGGDWPENRDAGRIIRKNGLGL